MDLIYDYMISVYVSLLSKKINYFDRYFSFWVNYYCIFILIQFICLFNLFFIFLFDKWAQGIQSMYVGPLKTHHHFFICFYIIIFWWVSNLVTIYLKKKSFRKKDPMKNLAVILLLCICCSMKYHSK